MVQQISEISRVLGEMPVIGLGGGDFGRICFVGLRHLRSGQHP
jgi:hypothetical protein